MQNDHGPRPKDTTDWHGIDNPPYPFYEDRPILVYWEFEGGCFLEKEFQFTRELSLVDKNYNPVIFPPNAESIVWGYWPNPPLPYTLPLSYIT